MRTAEQKLTKIKSLLERGELSKAIEIAEELQKKNKNSLEIMRVTAQLYNESNDLDKLKKQLTYIIEKHPNDTQSLVQLSHLHHTKRELKESLHFIKKAEKTDPFSPKVLNYKSIILNSLFRYDDAMSCLNKIVELGKDDHHTWNNLGLLNQSLGIFSVAEDCFLKSIKKSKNDDSAYNNLIILNHYKPDSTTEEKYKFLVNWQDIYAKKTKAFRHDKTLKDANKKLRIGILSDGLFTHPVGQMITTPVESLPYDEMEIFVYSTNLKEDKITKRLKEKSRKWCYIEHLDDLQLSKKIKDDNVDILFDLSGHMSGNRLKVMAMKPAPILVKWVGGLINTTGISTMDYLLSDPVETPVGVDEWYTEKLIRMPHGYVCYEAPSYSHDVYSPPSLHNGHITLGCFNNPQKINYVVLEQWAKIMHRLPDSKLFLKSYQFNSQTLVTNVKATMAELDITEDRLIIEGPSSHSDLLKAYNKVDIALDPWPYSGGLTTCEAMFMGVPVVTYPGPTFAGRHSATHLTNVGLEQLVANNWEEYCDLVVNLANDPDNLANIRKHLRGALLESPLCDAESFARYFANAMRAIWQRHCEGKDPAALTLNAEGECQFEDEEQPVTLQLPEKPAQSAAQQDNNEFNFNFTDHIIALEHGATLASRPHFIDFLKKGLVNYICLDPGGVIRNAQQLQHTGLFQYFPLTVLGDGSEMELALAVEAKRSTTLPIIAPDPNAIIPEQEPPALISTKKVTSNRIDDIEGLDHIDWLILDGQHHNLSILEHGSKNLTNALLIEVGVSSQDQQLKQISLVEIRRELERIGFTLIPFESSSVKEHPENNQAVFIPNNNRLEQLKNDDLSKLAFLLHTVYHKEVIATEIINVYSSERNNLILKKLKNDTEIKKTINLIDYKYIYNIDPFGSNVLEKAINNIGKNISYIRDKKDLIRKISSSDNSNDHFFTSHSFYNLTIDSPPYIQNINIFDLYSIRPFSIIDDHAYADFMLNRCYNSPRKITIGSKSQLLIEEFKKISKSNDIIEVIIPQKPPEYDAIEYKNKENCAVFVGKLYPNIPKNIREIKAKVKNENRLNIKEKQEVSDLIERRYICPFAEPELKKDTREITLLYFDYVDKFFRNYYRAKNLSKIIDRLNKFNIKTLIIGGDEKEWKMSINNNVEFEHIPTTDYRNSLRLMNASKFNININPSYPDTPTDRLVNMLGSNSLCISDSSPLLMTEEYKDIFIGREFITSENLSRAEELAYLQTSFANRKFSTEAAITQWMSCFNKHIDNCS